MDITDKIEQTLGERKVDEAFESFDAFQKIAKKYAKLIAKDVGKYERVLSTKMIQNDIYNAILSATNKGRI